MKIEFVTRQPVRSMVWTFIHACAVGVCVQMGQYGLAAASFCLFIDATLIKERA